MGDSQSLIIGTLDAWVLFCGHNFRVNIWAKRWVSIAAFSSCRSLIFKSWIFFGYDRVRLILLLRRVVMIDRWQSKIWLIWFLNIDYFGRFALFGIISRLSSLHIFALFHLSILLSFCQRSIFKVQSSRFRWSLWNAYLLSRLILLPSDQILTLLILLKVRIRSVFKNWLTLSTIRYNWWVDASLQGLDSL